MSEQDAKNVPSQQELQSEAQNFGLDQTFLLTMVQTFGPYVAKALLDLLKKRGDVQQSVRGEDHQAVPEQAAALNIGYAKQLLAILLVQHREDILNWLDEQEKKVYDFLVEKLEA